VEATNGGGRRVVGRLPVTVIDEGDVAPAADDDVIESADPHDLADVGEAAGDLQVFLAGGRIAARMVVLCDGGGAVTDHLRVNVARLCCGRSYVASADAVRGRWRWRSRRFLTESRPNRRRYAKMPRTLVATRRRGKLTDCNQPSLYYAAPPNGLSIAKSQRPSLWRRTTSEVMPPSVTGFPSGPVPLTVHREYNIAISCRSITRTIVFSIFPFSARIPSSTARMAA
jgi:hypothetical protein